MPCEKPLLSIIVPVYKVENYLQKCIDSILAQTFTDFELILVEDGSPDGCPALCDAAAAKDARIRVLHQKNGGLSAARNAGLDVARGEWIGFVDSDDYIAPEMYETLYKAVQSTGADLALCDYAAVDEAGTPCLLPYTAPAQRIFTGRELLKKATNTILTFKEFKGSSTTCTPRYLCAAALPGGQAERGYFCAPRNLSEHQKGRGGAKGAVLLCAARQQHYERKQNAAPF